MSSLKDKSVKGMIWTALERLLTHFSQFVVGIIIARALMPSDYGVIGVLAIFMAIAQTFLDSGFSSALIQKKDRTEEDFSTVFYFNVVVSLALYTILFIAAPYISEFYRLPILTQVSRAVSLSIIINGLTIVQTAKLTIDLNFRIQSLAAIFAVVVSGLIGIFLAYNGYGVWSLVVQGLSTSTIKALILWIYSKWRPKWLFSIESFKTMFSFGSKLLLSGLINTIYQNIYTLVIGRCFSASDVGFFNRAKHFAQLPSDTVSQTILKVNFPILSKFQDDNKQLISAYGKLLRVPIFVLCPLLTMIATLSEPMIDVLLGSKWLPCAPMLQVLCIGYVWVPLTRINLNLLNVKGRSDCVLQLEIIKKIIAFSILFVSLPFGIWWMCVGRALYSFIAFTLNCYYTKKILNYGFRTQMRELLPIFINSMIMCLIMALSINFFEESIIRLLAGVLLGAISYISYCLISKDESYYDVISILNEKLRK